MANDKSKQSTSLLLQEITELELKNKELFLELYKSSGPTFSKENREEYNNSIYDVSTSKEIRSALLPSEAYVPTLDSLFKKYNI